MKRLFLNYMRRRPQNTYHCNRKWHLDTYCIRNWGCAGYLAEYLAGYPAGYPISYLENVPNKAETVTFLPYFVRDGLIM